MSGILKSVFQGVKGSVAFPKSYPESIAQVITSFDGSSKGDEWVKLDMSPTDGSEGKSVLVSLSHLKSADDYLDYWKEEGGVMVLEPGTRITLHAKAPIEYSK